MGLEQRAQHGGAAPGATRSVIVGMDSTRVPPCVLVVSFAAVGSLGLVLHITILQVLIGETLWPF